MHGNLAERPISAGLTPRASAEPCCCTGSREKFLGLRAGPSRLNDLLATVVGDAERAGTLRTRVCTAWRRNPPSLPSSSDRRRRPFPRLSAPGPRPSRGSFTRLIPPSSRGWLIARSLPDQVVPSPGPRPWCRTPGSVIRAEWPPRSSTAWRSPISSSSSAPSTRGRGSNGQILRRMNPGRSRVRPCRPTRRWQPELWSMRSPAFKRDAAAHQQEHAIEVELPFLARLNPQTRVVGLAVGGGDWEHCRTFAHGLADVVSRLPTRPLLLISSDMNHFANDQETRRLDETAALGHGAARPRPSAEDRGRA